MADNVERRETVVLERDRDERNGAGLGWLIAVIVLVLLAMVFIFGLSPFSGGSSSGVNVETPTGTTQ